MNQAQQKHCHAPRDGVQRIFENGLIPFFFYLEMPSYALPLASLDPLLLTRQHLTGCSRSQRGAWSLRAMLGRC